MLNILNAVDQYIAFDLDHGKAFSYHLIINLNQVLTGSRPALTKESWKKQSFTTATILLQHNNQFAVYFRRQLPKQLGEYFLLNPMIPR